VVDELSQKEYQSSLRRDVLEYIKYLVDTCQFNFHAGSMGFLEAHNRAVMQLAEKGGVHHGFIIGLPTWEFPVGSLEFEYRDRVLIDCMTGLFSIGTFRTGLAVHTVYGMDSFPYRNRCLVGMPGSSLWERDGTDYHSNELLTCTISY